MSESNKQASSLSKLNLLLILVIGTAILIQENEQDRIVKIIIDTIDSTEALKQPVDFSQSTIQPINNGFMLVNAAQKEHLTGIVFTGRIINTQSVVHHNLKFTISVDDKEKEFTINKISSGNSTGFSVFVPNIKAINARYANIKYIESSISYYTK